MSLGGYNGPKNWRTSRGFNSNNPRPYYPPGTTKPAHDNLYWKLRYYSEEDDSTAKAKGKSALSVDFHKDENSIAHKTELYGVKNLVVRRGQEFKIGIQVNVPFDANGNNLELLFLKGDKPQESKNTLVRVNVHKDKTSAEKESPEYWKAYISAIDGKSPDPVTISVLIRTPADALVGLYKVQTKLIEIEPTNEQRRALTKDEEEGIYIIFNAWCKDDQVYMEDEMKRKEFVMNETGRIWVGKSTKALPRPWNFGQFSRYCLEAAIYLLEKCKTLQHQGHGNATLVCRAMSAMANKAGFTDDGVLVGNWSGKFDGGTSPGIWNGSQAILEEFMTTKKPVKFGQCWVFAGLLTTLGRTLGIPTRPVTNYESAHDKDMSMTIDTHFDVTGKPLSKMNDSVWNFHVWNESWFKRPDLPDGYDSWQAYDATPQESSEGIYMCGPSPVKAIKEGNVYLGYDTKFIFAEVNGDYMIWIVFPDSGYMYCLKGETKTNLVGKCISTKMPGSSERDDITSSYKFAEGSKEERQAVARASRFSSRQKQLYSVYKQDTSDVKFSYNGQTKSNGDVHISVSMENTSIEERIITLSITINAAYYTGIPAEELSNDTVQIVLKPSEKKDKAWTIHARDYINIIDEDAKLKMYLMAMTAGTKQVYTMQDMFEIDKPELQLEVSEKNPKIGEKFEVTINMTNPLEVKLTEGVVSIEGPGIQKSLKIPIHRSINPGEKLSEKVSLTAKYAGTREIIACFNSRQLTGITGVIEVHAEYKKAAFV